MSWELEPLEVEKVVEISVLDHLILTGFPTNFVSDRRAEVEESTPDCCGFPEMFYAPSGIQSGDPRMPQKRTVPKTK